MNPVCPLRNEAFKAKAIELDIHEDVLYLLVHKYANTPGNAEFPSDSYIKNNLFPKTPVYSYPLSYNLTKDEIKQIRAQGITGFATEEEAKAKMQYIIDETSVIPYAVKVVRRHSGKYDVVIADPELATQAEAPNVVTASHKFNYTTGQQKAIDAVNKHIENVKTGKKNSRFFLVEGKAGTGKTSILDTILEGIKGGTFSTPMVITGAPTHKATMVIGTKVHPQSNIMHTNMSIAAALGMKLNEKTGEFEVDKSKKTAPIDNATVLIFDEASMIGEKEMKLIEEALGKRRVPVIFLGDKGQLPPVRKDSFYKGYTKQQLSADSPVFYRDDIESISLTERVRQGKTSPILEYSDRFHNFTLEGGEQLPDDRGIRSEINDEGALIIQPTNVDLVKQLTPLFKQAMETENPNLVKIVAYTTSDEKKESAVSEYNRKIREALYPGSNPEEGFLKGDLVIMNDNFKKDDMIIPNSLEGVVVKVEKSDANHSVQRLVGKKLFEDLGLSEVETQIVTFKSQSPNGIIEYQLPVVVPYKENTDKLNSNIRKIANYCKNGHKDQWGSYWDLKQKFAAKLGYAYAVSSHKSQGSTYDVVAVDATNITSVGPTTHKTKSQSIYVGVTRASNVTIVKSPTSDEDRIFTDIQSINNRINSVKAGTAEGEFHPETEENYEAVTMSDEEVKKAYGPVGGVLKNSKDAKDWDTVDADMTSPSYVQSASTELTGDEEEGDWDNPDSFDETVDKQQKAYKEFVSKQTMLNNIIDFDEKTHTYKVNDKKADYSVTSFRNKLIGVDEEETNEWLEVASRLGTIHDEILRDFFMGQVKASYPNVSKEQLGQIKIAAAKLQTALKKQFGNDAIFITDEKLLRVASKVTQGEDEYLIAGTLDMVVIDNEGNKHIIDFKTMRSNNHTDMTKEKQIKYGFQVSMYNEMLSKSLGSSVKGTYIAQLNLKYESPSDVKYTFNNKQVLVNGKNIQETGSYEAGRLKAFFPLSMNLSSHDLNVTPIKTGIQQGIEAKNENKKTTPTPDIDVTSYNKKYKLLLNFGAKPFTITDSKGKEQTFQSVEHYFGYVKAITTGDMAMANKIRYAKTPEYAKKLHSHDLQMTERQIHKWNNMSENVMAKGMRAAFDQNPEAVKLLLSTGNARLLHSIDVKSPFAKLLMTIRKEHGGSGIPEKVTSQDEKAAKVQGEIQGKADKDATSALIAAQELIIQQQQRMKELEQRILALEQGKSPSSSKENISMPEISEAKRKAQLEAKIKAEEEKKQQLIAAMSKERQNQHAASEARKRELEELNDDFFSIQVSTETPSGLTASYVLELKKQQSIPAVDKEGKLIGETVLDITNRGEDSPKAQVLKRITSCMEYSSTFTLSGHVNLNMFFTIDNLLKNKDIYIDGYSETVSIDPNSAEGIIAAEYARENSKFPYDPEKGELKIPKFTVGYSRKEIESRLQMDKLTNSNVLKTEEIRALAKATIYKMSEHITMIQSNINGYEHFFGRNEGDENLDKDFTKMSRIEIIKEIGIANLLNTVRDRVFTLEGKKMSMKKKVQLIRSNWEAFTTLGYDTLIGLEEISLSDKENVKDATDTLWEDKTEEEIQELFGSSIEHWQVGFRQVSTFNSLSQLIKRALDSLYQLDEEGNVIYDEYGLGKHLNPQEAVSKILYFTQGATSLDLMIEKLKDRIDSLNQWITLIVELLEGKKDDKGEIIEQPDEQFRTLFFNNFKKYFQKYSITYKKGRGKKAQTVIKVINESEHKDLVVDSSIAKENSFATGAFNLKNKNGSINEENLEKLKQLSKKLNDTLLNIKKSGKIEEHVDLNEYHKLINDTLDLLNIDKPALESLYRIFSKKVNFETLANKVKYLIPLIKEGVQIAGISDYGNIAEVISKEMGLEMESVSYEAGKMYYSYVLPSYLGNLVGKLKSDNMSDEEYKKFILDEYTRYKWFEKDGKIRNYWLEQLINSKTVRSNFNHIASLHYMETGYADKTPALYIASMMQMYFFDDSKKWAYYRMPMMSNKPSEEYLKFKRLSNKEVGNYKKFIVDKMHQVFLQELDRIQAVRERNGYSENIDSIREDQKINSKGKKGTFDKNGLQFVFEDYLPVKSKEINGKQVFLATTDNSEAAEFAKLIEKKLSNTLGNEGKDLSRLDELFEKFTREGFDNNYQDARLQWMDEGFLSYVEDNEGNKQMKLFGGAKYSEEDLEEFFWNDAFAAVNILLLTVTDTAFYVDTEDLQKRLAQLHAPGTRADISATYNGLKYTADGIERTIYLQDEILKSEISPNLAQAFDLLIAEARSEHEAEVLRQLKDSILDAFKKVNVADAQGYNCPSSYRKKMGVFGKWNEKMENAYNMVLHPELMPADAKLSDYLDILWQPLKPFVYTQVSLNGYNQTLPELKVSVQNKNSEYVLILADAIMRRAGNRANRLSAIFEMMEASLHDNSNKLNGKGIDTVQFMSAVNAGCSGVLNLNYSEDRLKQVAKDHDLGKVKDFNALEKALEKKGITGKEKFDIMDSVRLSEADIKAILLKAFYNADGSYNKDYVHEIPFEDYMILQEVPAHFRGHSQAHGSQDRILTFADIVDKDARGDDNYLTIDGKEVTVAQAKKNYFNAIAENINDSMTQLVKRFNLNAYDKRAKNVALSRVLKDTILKDSRFGSDLLWACDTNKFGDFNIPLSDPIQANRILQLLNSIIKNEINKQEIAGGPVVQVSTWGTSDELHIRFKDDEGKILLTEQEFELNNFPEDYEEKYALKEEGLTYKDYIQYQAGVAYFECYVPIQDENIVKDFTTIDENGDEVIDIKAMEKANPKLLEMVGYRIPTESKYSMVPIRVKGFLPRTAGEGIMMPAEITSLAGSDFDIDKLYIMRHLLVRGKNGKWSNPKPGTRAYRDNLIISTQLAVLQSELVQKQLFTPGNFDVPKLNGYLISYILNEAKKTGRSPRVLWDEAMEIRAKMGDEDFSDWCKDKNKTAKNLIFNHTLVLFHKQNMAAGKLIGIFAQANVSHGFVSLVDDTTLDIPQDNEFTIDNTEVEGNINIDELRTLDKEVMISNNLAAFLAASVDAVKDPILNLININTNTANLLTSMLRMGFSIETVSLLCAQPVLRDLVKEYGIRKAEHRVSLQSIIDEKLEKLDESTGGAMKNLRAIVTTDLLIDNLNGHDDEISYMTLKIFDKMLAISDTFGDITHMTRYNSIASAVGPFASDTMLQRVKAEAFENNGMVGDNTRRACHNPILSAFLHDADIIERALLGLNMIQASSALDVAMLKCSDRLGYKKGMPSDLANKFSDFYMSYYVNTSSRGTVFDLSKEHREHMLKEFPGELQLLKDLFPDNILLNSIQIIQRDTEQFPVLQLKTRGMTAETIEDLKLAWASLATSSNTMARNISQDLVEYCFFRGSFGFSPKTFTNLIPNVVKMLIPNYIETLNALDSKLSLQDDELTNRMINQFILHNTDVIPYKGNSLKPYDPLDISEGRIEIDKKSDNKKARDLTLSVGQIIKLAGNIYLVDSETRDTYRLKLINHLGGLGQGFEINVEEDFPESIFDQDLKKKGSYSSQSVDGIRNIPQEDLQVIMDSVYEEDEAEGLTTAKSNDVIDTMNARLKEQGSKIQIYPRGRNVVAITAIRTALAEQLKDSTFHNILNGSNKTIEDLNLCKGI